MTFTSQPSLTITSEPEPTNTPQAGQTSIPTTPTLDIGSTMTGKDGLTLLYVPAGEFTMGSDNGEPNEKPAHSVYLNAFWIDQTEVTNLMYGKCVQNAGCDDPNNVFYLYDPNYANHPVMFVSWIDANNYCSWADRRLPTEAEWEKAARGENSLIYPWGNVAPNNNLLNSVSYYITGGTTEVGTYPNGASPYGALDMAGNVWEWVADWYDAKYYATIGANVSNPQGPPSGQYRVLRGGSLFRYAGVFRSAYRESWDPLNSNGFFGFRCAMSATP